MITQKNPKFVCNFCDFNTSNKKDYTRHLSTQKHMVNAGLSNILPQKTPNHVCECGNKYTYLSGLIKHKKQCENEKNYEKNVQIQNIDTCLVIELLKQNQELQKTIIELSKEKGVITNSNNNSYNKTFNLHFFLNEQCKDAVNITDFVNSIKIQLKDLERVGELGYVQGISEIVINNLEQLDTCKRPIHCSDLKREILYIKDEDQWFKENENKTKLTNVIKKVAHENIKQISNWVKENPDCKESDSKKNDQYMKIVSNSMSGGTKEEQNKNINQIIKNLAKEVVITK